MEQDIANNNGNGRVTERTRSYSNSVISEYATQNNANYVAASTINSNNNNANVVSESHSSNALSSSIPLSSPVPIRTKSSTPDELAPVHKLLAAEEEYDEELNEEKHGPQHLLDSYIGSEKFSDVKLIVEDEPIYSHQLILAANSPVFDAMLLSGMKESKTKEITIPNLKRKTIQMMLHYFYTGELPDLILANDVEVAINLFHAASQYQCIPLVNLASKALIKFTNEITVCSILQVAIRHHHTLLSAKAFNFIRENTSKVCKSGDLSLLTKETLIEILQDDGLNISEELELFNAVLRWGENKPIEEMQVVFDSIRFPLMSASDLTEVVETTQLIPPYLLIEAYRYHANPAASIQPQNKRAIARGGPHLHKLRFNESCANTVGVSLSKNRTVAHFIGSKWQSVTIGRAMTYGKHSLTVCGPTENFMVGLCSPNAVQNNDKLYESNEAVLFQVHNSTRSYVWNCGSSKSYGRNTEEGENITVHLNFEKRTVHFDINGENFGDAIRSWRSFVLPSKLMFVVSAGINKPVDITILHNVDKKPASGKQIRS